MTDRVRRAAQAAAPVIQELHRLVCTCLVTAINAAHTCKTRRAERKNR